MNLNGHFTKEQYKQLAQSSSSLTVTCIQTLFDFVEKAVFSLSGPGWERRFCGSGKLPGGAGAAGPQGEETEEKQGKPEAVCLPQQSHQLALWS